MSLFSYVYLKVVVTILRFLRKSRGKEIAVHPDRIIQIPSRDKGRTLTTHVYTPNKDDKKQPSPVLINFHGSGFVFPMHGTDDEFARRIGQQSGYIVLDVRYRLAPENPFPAALHDVEDAVNWVLDQPGRFDVSRVAISGFSAGGNLALAAASCVFPQPTFSSLLAFYPPTDISQDPETKTAPSAGGKPIPAFMAKLFNRCYGAPPLDPRDPRISPSYADPQRFPHRVLIVTAGYDNLAPEAEELAGKIAKVPGRAVVCQRMEGCNHGWDKTAQKGTLQEEAKERMISLALEMLK
ncbi:hypothetical protein ASPZODRAFT_71893 [Penicilliopsis zonata CBS 506.65]|uniref:Alpha/beta hydrolase fold-3 domain-containing protein n=1 Tax=Penicilliopsis zonata CBS 506.65 TaxID=1073090 RepID=A0A1L9SAN4_9EURO|nr:hypothetical protein ASPZODRAFT_71893 [Penicilliopsis zonata CBS 506.65]OJJ44242.1 hypothetical protein ASPZODRAFT_71893 [Penicilliopsis zonata CBS 506.65]